jgi:hypothetical protein
MRAWTARPRRHVAYASSYIARDFPTPVVRSSIHQRIDMALALLLLSLLQLSGCCAGRTAGGSKPHIVFLLQDDLGHYECACQAHHSNYRPVRRSSAD